MSYSNTIKDKTQSNHWKKVKLWLFYGVLSFVTYTSLVNIYRQWDTLKVAQNRKDELENRLNEAEYEKKKFLKLAEEASSSTVIERKQRQYFGIGTDRDYWLVMPNATEEGKLSDRINEVETKPNLIKWWELFTKRIL